MKRSQFAALCGVSKQQITKYGDAIVTTDGGDVDVEASLANLEGRLNDVKRERALALWSGRKVAAAPADDDREPAGLRRPSSGKARHDEAKAELAELELAEKKRQLVPAREVELAAYDAVAALKDAQSAGRREFADVVCSEFGLDAARAGALARKLAARDDVALAAFSEAVLQAVKALTEADGASAARAPLLAHG